MSVKRDNFKRISEARLAKMAQLYGQLENLSNLSFYEYDEKDIEAIFSSLEEASAKAKSILLDAIAKKGKRRRL